MQFVFTRTVVVYEWMPDGKVKELFEKYADVHDYSDGQSFGLEGVVDYFQDEMDQEAVIALEQFMADNNLTGFAFVEYSW